MSIETDADVASRYLNTLLARGVANSDAVNMTNAYVSSRLMWEGMRDAKPISVPQRYPKS